VSVHLNLVPERRAGMVRKMPKKRAASKKAARSKAVRCAAMTKEKKKCKRMALGNSKYCSVHRKG
jgi:hypothetical protein